jgi:hypothetical protein
VADKGYKSVDMFQNWETPITSMEAKQLNGTALFAMTSKWNQLIITICTIFEIH